MNDCHVGALPLVHSNLLQELDGCFSRKGGLLIGVPGRDVRRFNTDDIPFSLLCSRSCCFFFPLLIDGPPLRVLLIIVVFPFLLFAFVI